MPSLPAYLHVAGMILRQAAPASSLGAMVWGKIFLGIRLNRDPDLIARAQSICYDLAYVLPTVPRGRWWETRRQACSGH
jgi:hypothetical protein